MYTSKTLYFEKGGREHSQAALSAMKERAEAMDPAPEAIVVTSTTGDTALKAAQAFKGTGRRIIAVPFQKHLWAAYAGLNPEHRAACAELGVEFLPDEPRVPLVDEERPDIVNAWRVVSQGFKVALQAASMCVDTGLVEDGAVVMAAGGTSSGADTAIVVQTRGHADILRSNVLEIIAMPKR
ncbi:MAG TPA: hypothetical protein HPP83_02195 [Candidatus Hydrogenedentes bacterium]|nr:hypothetical protein [Candidatus Hydrogenedentota bacterium]